MREMAKEKDIEMERERERRNDGKMAKNVRERNRVPSK